MGCVMTKAFDNWCKDRPGNIKGEDKHKYCIFHLPKPPLQCELDEFNELIFARIDAAISTGELCDMRGTVFAGDIDFGRYNEEKPLPEIDFKECVFTGKADFSKCVFGAPADFRKAEFQREATFEEANFTDIVRFEKSVFITPATFEKAFFNAKAHFFDAVFKEKVSFHGATFVKELYMSWGSFAAGADLSGVIYKTNPVLKRPMR